MNHNKAIDSLLDLDGMIIEQAGGYWTKFEVRKLSTVSEERPHGIRYSLTLHNKYGTRVMGFDNAHAVKASKKSRYRGWKTYDHYHRHTQDEGIPYKFIDPHQLLKDFWAEVDKTLKELGVDKV